MNPLLRMRTACLFALATLASLIFFAAPAPAQSAAEAAKIASTLPAASQTVLARLAVLHLLPDGPWRMHAGDIAHGEALDLDDSTWEKLDPKRKAAKDTVHASGSR